MKKTSRNGVFKVTMALLMAAGIASCSDKNQGTAHLDVRMTDSPANYQEVNIDIQDVQVNAQSGDPNSGWQSLSVSKGVYNLLKLTNGLDTLLGKIDLPVGRVSQIRLILGDNNSVKINGVITKLTTPSAQQSGLKVQINTDLKDGVTYKILLDFDAARSIVITGSGSFILKPVIRTIITAETGAIKGAIDPISASPVIYAIAGTDSVSTYANTTGNFLVKGLNAGTYRLVLVPKTGFLTTEKTNVIVTTGNVTDVGTITIH